MSPKKDYSVCWIQCPLEVVSKLSEYGFHRGYDRDFSGRDRGLMKCFPKKGVYSGKIKRFLNHASWEAASFQGDPGVVTIWDVNATDGCKDKLLKDLPARTFVAKFDSFAEGLEVLKNHFGDEIVRLREDQKRMPVVLVKSPTDVVKYLKDAGLVQFVNRVEKTTGIDQCLIYFFDKFKGTDLSGWFKVLNEEAEGLGVPVGVWHPKATESVCRTIGREVVLIDSMTVDGAIEQLEEGLNR